MDKRAVRQLIRSLKKEQGNESIREAGRAAVAALLALPCYKEADAVFTYIGMVDEIDTMPLIERANADGKTVACPQVTGREMVFRRVRSADDARPGCMGILEPSDTAILDPLDFEKPLFIMPGLAFCRDGRRVGYGGGYYDRYLEKRRGIMRVALACSFQILPSLPADPYDIPLGDLLITEKEVIEIGRR